MTHDEEQETRARDRGATEPERLRLFRAQPVERIGQSDETDRFAARVHPFGEVDEILVESGREAPRRAGPESLRLPDLGPARMVLHTRDHRRRYLAVGDDAAGRSDRRDPGSESFSRRANERVEIGVAREFRLREPGEERAFRRQAVNRPFLRRPVEQRPPVEVQEERDSEPEETEEKGKPGGKLHVPGWRKR